MKYIFIDTNIFLHFRDFEEINWLEESSSEQCKIIIAPIVIDELDSKKIGNNKISNRARRALNKIEEFCEINLLEIKKNIFFELILEKPSKSTYTQYNLNFDEQDHRLIASILEFSKNHSINNILLYTNDVGPRLRARQLNIQSLKPNSKYFLKDELTEDERKIKALEKENLTLKSKIPNISLELSSGTFHKFILQPLKDIDFSRYKNEKITVLKNKFPYLSLKETENSLLPKLFVYDKMQIESYNQDLDNYFFKYEESLKEIFDYEKMQSLTFKTNFTVLNEGNTPAENIDIHLSFPSFLNVVKVSSLKDSPKLPDPPYKPAHRFDYSKLKLDPIFSSSKFKINTDLDFHQSCEITKLNSNHIVNYNIKNLKHGYNETLNKIAIVFSEYSEIKSFKIDYIISADNIPNKLNGELNFIFE